MNLIEQLGGYEKAKSMCDHINGSLGLITDGYSHYTKAMVVDALLEHRRANNIFEVGDLVYPLTRILDEHEGIGRFILVEKGEIVVVREVKQKGLYVSHENRHDNSFYVYFHEIRHATPEEIKAGKRL